MIRIKSTVRDLMFPTRCIKCRRLMSTGHEVFCRECLSSWQEIYAPRCLTGADAPRGADAAVYLALYRKRNPTGALERLIYHVKHVGSRRVTGFVVSRLAKELTVQDGTPIITYPPRRRAAIRRDGFDQAAQLARGLARRVEGEYATLFRRAHLGEQEQKKLDFLDRKRNADTAFLPTRHLDGRVRGRTVILVDDLTTTGATLTACTALLREAGAGRVIWATIARNEME